ncbi:alpha-L-rhamnosidase [Niabella ginsenosidivorans]|uniref:alpha-L-rhamnosidase n=1 Tax=Niabella ginsenosidivorans TaxID=1176587 RepID=A0A1A9I6I8_9BACT|nr:alpha-L-rhamnosidase C-terminal domain-containing protein [Niabella ginsenosidivorans]ANH82669.1 alpha-L-rhamnosidase [Niabella ginsenosidivorans]
MILFCRKTYCCLTLLIALTLVIDTSAQQTAAPTELRVDLVLNTDKVWQNGFVINMDPEEARTNRNIYQTVRIASSRPRFSWVINSGERGAYQTAYQVLVASSAQKLQSGIGDVWNSGRVASDQQLNVEYNGKDLNPNTVYYWKVKIWDNKKISSPFSKTAAFLTDSILKPYQTPYTPLVKSAQQPLVQTRLGNGNSLYDFGKDAFGQLSLVVNAVGDQDTLRIHVGEALDNMGCVEKKPKGTLRYQLLEIPLKKGRHPYCPVFKPAKLNTGPRAIHMPAYIGEVLPFRYVEVEKTNTGVQVINPERYAVNYIFNDTATEFESSDTVLNKVWDLCKYTMKATSFTGFYVDGDRERTPYEADALINQLSHYATDAEYNMAKRSLEYLVYHATWPAEWSLQNLLIAWNDYIYSGDIRTVKNLYAELRPKTLLALARPDGLISTRTGKQDSNFAKSIHLIHFDGKTVLRDIVDWPQRGGVGLPATAMGETDGFEFTDYNSVVNAFHYQALICMEKLAKALGKKEDATFYEHEAAKVKQAFQRSFIDPASGIVKDGEGTTHSSLHANMMALAFGLVPPEIQPNVLSFIQSRGMACSVYGAQFLMDALYDANNAGYGLRLLTATGKRSWYNMIRSGATMTTEAWDTEYKGNQDWNHAWGAAPANIIVGKLMGITPLSPAFGTIAIKPRPGTLSHAGLQLATLRGKVAVVFDQQATFFRLQTRLPANTQGVVYLPRRSASDVLLRNGKRIVGLPDGDFWMVKEVRAGRDVWEVHYHQAN